RREAPYRQAHRLPPGPRSIAIDRTENTIMTHATPSVAATFAALFAALFVAHQVADHWVQTSHQAAHKGLPGWRGRLACAAHVASYTLTTTMAVLGVWLALDLPVTLGGVLLGQAVSAVTHYWADQIGRASCRERVCCAVVSVAEHRMS